MRLTSPPGKHSGDHSPWGVFHRYIVPSLIIVAPLIIGLQYLFGYVELTPSSLEYQSLWKHRSIPYFEIERIVPGLRIKGKFVNVSVTEIYVYGAKKLSLRLDRHQDFLNEIRQYAPQARFEELAAAGT